MPRGRREKASTDQDERDAENDRRGELAYELAVEEVEPARAERKREEDEAVERRAGERGDDDSPRVVDASSQRRADEVVDCLRHDERREARTDDAPGRADRRVERLARKRGMRVDDDGDVRREQCGAREACPDHQLRVESTLASSRGGMV